MKTIYNELFYVPRHAKVSDKTLLIKVIISVAVIICCLAAMSLSAYAFFSYEVSSVSNVIRSANYNISITAYDNAGEPIAVISEGGFTYKISLEAGKEYTVNIQARGTAQTGFCILTASDCENIYHTQQLGITQDGHFDEILFTVKPTAETLLCVEAHWGTSVYYGYSEDYGLYIQNAEHIELPVVLKNDGLADSITEEEIVRQPVESTSSQAPLQSVPTDSLLTESSSTEEQQEEQNISDIEDTSSQQEDITSSEAVTSTNDTSSRSDGESSIEEKTVS